MGRSPARWQRSGCAPRASSTRAHFRLGRASPGRGNLRVVLPCVVGRTESGRPPDLTASAICDPRHSRGCWGVDMSSARIDSIWSQPSPVAARRLVRSDLCILPITSVGDRCGRVRSAELLLRPGSGGVDQIVAPRSLHPHLVGVANIFHVGRHGQRLCRRRRREAVSDCQASQKPDLRPE